MSHDPLVDTFIIGGGIHGTGIAAEAASRKLSVLLCEKADLGSGASSRTSTLISGGIQSLSMFELDVVRRSFNEQAILARRAPHLIRHLAFAIPINKEIRSKSSLKAGLLLYNSLRPAECKSGIDFAPAAGLLEDKYADTLKYNDCTINDARLVISNAILARQLGAKIRTYSKVHSAKRNQDKQCWEISLVNGEKFFAKSLINTTGKDTNKIMAQVIPSNSRCVAQLLRGDHIVLPKLYDEHQGYLLQMPEKQLLYVVPYRQEYTLVGSFEQLWQDGVCEETLANTAIDSMLQTLNTYFTKKHTRDDVVRHFWAVRSAYDDINDRAERISYDVALDLECPDNYAPLINLFGGRLTTYRDAAEKSLELLKPYLHTEKNKAFKNKPLPGGDIINGELEKFIEELQFAYPWLPKDYAERYARLYGTLCHQFLNDCGTLEDLGKDLGFHLHEKEVVYLVQNEWSTRASDILWRRTRLGFSFLPQQVEVLEQYIAQLC